MPTWSDVLNELKESGHTTDVVRRRYLRRLFSVSKRNTVIYYSGWLQKGMSRSGSGLGDFGINDLDKNAFTSVTDGLDPAKGLDLILHTPGGDMAATESIIDYLRQRFGKDIRAIVPQIAMSGGSMIACACKEILMAAHSNLGPFDPQINGMAAQAIKNEFERAAREIKADNTRAYVWQPILQEYQLGFISSVEQAIDMADTVVKQALKDCMFDGDANADAIADTIVQTLGSHAATQTHARHIHRKRAKALGLKIVDLESDPKLYNAVMAVHQASMITFEHGSAFKMLENHLGSSFIYAQPAIAVMGAPIPPGA
jgi:ClpP class serine protease